MKQDTLAGECERLFNLLDDIDTADDIAKADDATFRLMVRALQRKRFDGGITTDGYTLDLSALRTDGEANSRAVPSGEAVETFLHELDQWEAAYPLSAFPEPDLKRAAELLKAGGMTLDAISASNMRHVVSCIAPKALAALSASKPDDASALLKEALDAGLTIATHMNERLYNGRTGQRPATIDTALRTLARIDASLGRDGA